MMLCSVGHDKKSKTAKSNYLRGHYKTKGGNIRSKILETSNIVVWNKDHTIPIAHIQISKSGLTIAHHENYSPKIIDGQLELILKD